MAVTQPAAARTVGTAAVADGVAFFVSKALVCAYSAHSLDTSALKVGLGALTAWFLGFAVVGVRRLLSTRP